MYWQEETSKTINSQETVILSLKVKIAQLPVDHIAQLSQLILEKAPYLKNESNFGIHTIHGAESGNGWHRVEDGSAVFFPSARSLLRLQLPSAIASKVSRDLNNLTARLFEHDLTLRQAKINKLYSCDTIFARYVADDYKDENKFLYHINNKLKQLNITANKLLCGMTHTIKTPKGKILTRSLMLADLDIADALILQSLGIGDYKQFGCGLFLPHKKVEDVWS